MVDCVIIGTGAAGVSAALTLKALNKNFILLGNKNLSKKIRTAEQIKNYPGLKSVSGGQMQAAFLAQLKEEEIEITEGKVNGVYPTEGGYTVMCENQPIETKTVILCTGVEAVKPIKGEAEFLGMGVSYCGVCDGFLYRGKKIAVTCESAEELEEVKLVAGYAEKVYLFPQKAGLKIDAPNVEVMDGRIREIVGDMRVRAVIYTGGELPVDGVFVFKQAVGAGSLVHGLKTEGGIVPVGRDCSTNLAGVFAAGDITGRPYQYAKAVGEGNVCAYSVNSYLNKKN